MEWTQSDLFDIDIHLHSNIYPYPYVQMHVNFLDIYQHMYTQIIVIKSIQIYNMQASGVFDIFDFSCMPYSTYSEVQIHIQGHIILEKMTFWERECVVMVIFFPE